MRSMEAEEVFNCHSALAIASDVVQVSAAEDEPARYAASHPACCTQRWTLNVINWRQVCRGKFFFLSSEFRTKFQREVPLFLEIPEFSCNTV